MRHSRRRLPSISRATMNDRMTKRLERFEAVAHVLAEAPPNALAIPAFAGKVARLRELLAAIHAAATRQMQTSESATIACRQRFDHMIELAVHLAGVIGIVARERNLVQIAREVQVSRHSFVRLRSPSRHILAARILDTAEEFAADLVPYGITAGSLAEFRAAIAAAKQGATAPRVAIGARRVAAVALTNLFRDTNHLLTHTIDVLMFSLRHTDQTFYKKYQLARMINQRRNGSRRKSTATATAAPMESIPA